MLRKPLCCLAMIVLLWDVSSSWARDGLAVTLPRRSRLTPVQQLNREGVEAVRKQDYARAESLFYKAYLYDPSDPFTLNNLGFISELQGQLDRASKFYNLALEQGSNADIDVSNVKTLEGQPMKAAFLSVRDTAMRVNQVNVSAMQLLAEGRGFEAVDQLKQALALDPQNPFTLNNLGVAEESMGDYQSALRDYWAASRTGSKEPAMVTGNKAWSGKPVSEMAAANEQRLAVEVQKGGRNKSQAAMFSMRGVLAANQNDLETAKQDFMRAYTLDPTSAFSLNNRGFVAELEGDLESAQYFYVKAQKAEDASASVGLATKSFASGKNLLTVAVDSNTEVDSALDRYSQQRRKQTGPIELTPRGNPGTGNSNSAPNQPTSNPTATPKGAAPKHP